MIKPDTCSSWLTRVHSTRYNHNIPSLTVIKRKNRCILCIYWDSAIFSVVTEYSNLFPSFTFFLNCSHSTFCYEFTIGSKATDIMKIICNVFSFV